MSIEAMKLALEALEVANSWGTWDRGSNAVAALRQAIEQAEQREDAYLFYAPGDVLISKESDEKVVVKHGNTGPMQLANGKIALEWNDDVYGEYTLEQVMDGFIREGYAPRIKQAEQAQRREWVELNLFDRTLLRLTHAPARVLHYDKQEDMDIAAEVVTDWDSFLSAIEAKLKEKNDE